LNRFVGQQEDEEQSVEDDQDGHEEEEDYSVGFHLSFLHSTTQDQAEYCVAGPRIPSIVTDR
jgi:hypothetical protein